ncbi:TetR/AcrR family transcriptional regulator [Zhongshania aliphaticivorans]|uniref:TetR/AcrR family transcriptional regulator n=1 Tax=Zhongshania aliphaticivorans TaxID=1470434 RepID=UPI0039E4B333
MAESPKKARVPQTQRTAIMRYRLSKAAFEVIKDVGFANFRTSAVSKQAGVSQGAQLHHYPTKNDLTLAAMQYAYEQSNSIFTRNIAAFRPDDDPVDAAMKDAEDFFMSDYFMVALDILMAGGKNEELRGQQIELAVTSRSLVEKAWIDRLVDLGWDKELAEDILNISFCLVRGYVVKMLISENPKQYQRLVSRWKAMVSATIKQEAAPTTQ